jgi:hypothetical protein
VVTHQLNINTFKMLHMVIQGDWICIKCASICGIEAGIEGHEWEVTEPEPESPEHLEDDWHENLAGDKLPLPMSNEGSDSEASMQEQPKTKKRAHANPRLLFESDSDSD